jgi:hypothetical protein
MKQLFALLVLVILPATILQSQEHPWEGPSTDFSHGKLIVSENTRRLMESRPFLSRIPDQSLIVPAYFPETDYVVATRGEGYAFIYIPTGCPVVIQSDKVGAEMINAYWYDPRNGETKLIDKISGKVTRKFTPPTNGRGNDWILVLDDASKNFLVPQDF